MIGIALLICTSAAMVSSSLQLSHNDLFFRRELRGSGLNRELFTEISTPLPSTCVLSESITNDWFIDIEEMPKSPSFLFNSSIDIELPASLSKSHSYSITINTPLTFSFPIHMRYNNCSHQNYQSIIIPGPSIRCGDKEFPIGQKIGGQVPVGNLGDLNTVIAITTVTVAISVFWISLTIHHSFKAE